MKKIAGFNWLCVWYAEVYWSLFFGLFGFHCLWFSYIVEVFLAHVCSRLWKKTVKIKLFRVGFNWKFNGSVGWHWLKTSHVFKHFHIFAELLTSLFHRYLAKINLYKFHFQLNLERIIIFSIFFSAYRLRAFTSHNTPQKPLKTPTEKRL